MAKKKKSKSKSSARAKGKVWKNRRDRYGWLKQSSSGAKIRSWNSGILTFDILGVDEVISRLRSIEDGLEDAILEGLQDAGEYTIGRIQYIIDEGNFTPLAECTPEIESRLYNASYPNDILKMNGDLYNSFYFQTMTAGSKYALQIQSQCEHLAYNVFGVPNNGWGRRVPSRDPISPVTKRFKGTIVKKMQAPVYKLLNS